MKMSCTWSKEDYFSLLMKSDKKAYAALEMLVDDLHLAKEATISTFLCHSGAEDFLWGLVRLLGLDNPRVAGNSAYIIGTLAESDLGCHRILGLAKGHNSKKGEKHNILADLTRMLKFDDAESVMNAAGTMGTLAESFEGREWMLSQPCIDELLEHITSLLQNDNLWTASNAALVLARISISENGCLKVLNHSYSTLILSRLIHSLGVDEAGRGMNAAFAIGRLCDIEIGRKRLLELNESEKMLSSLARMLSCDDTGSSKNACFALSCLATNEEGHTRLLNNIHSDDILKTLSSLLTAEDNETGWFAAMTLRTLASQPRGCLRLRESIHVIPSLKAVEQNPDINSDLKEEVTITLEILKRLERPAPPRVEVTGPHTIKASWEEMKTRSGFPVKYQLFEGNKCLYTGKDMLYESSDFLPCTQYNFKLRAITEGDESPFSEMVVVVTEESVPEAPLNLRAVGATISQLKIAWEPPEFLNGTLKGYHVYLNDKHQEHTTDQMCIISGLQPSTSYQISVCASTSKGKGEKAFCSASTSDVGAHAPGKPHVQVIGRNEMHISWDPPEVPLGRITRYDVIMNKTCIYSGTDLAYSIRRLIPDTEYTFTVVALTNEGKFESKATKKKTSKDEFDGDRPPLYQTPHLRKESVPVEERPPVPTVTKKKKQVAVAPPVEQKARTSSANNKRSVTPADKKNKSPEKQESIRSRPTSANSNASAHQPPHIQEVPESDQQLKEIVLPQKVAYENKPPTPPLRQKTLLSAKENARQKIQAHGASPNHNDRQLSKMFPVNMSYVSIQTKEENNSLDSTLPTVTNSDTHRKNVGNQCNYLENQSKFKPSGYKFERSRTVVGSMKRTDGRNTQSKIDQTLQGNSFNVSASVNAPDFNSIPNAAVTNEKQNIKQISKSRGFDFNPGSLSKSDSFGSSQNGHSHFIHNVSPENSMSPSKTPCSVHEERFSMKSASERAISAETNSKLIRRKSKDFSLPRPEKPSQQYLEGGIHSRSKESPWASRSLPSPRLYKELTNAMDGPEIDTLTKRKLKKWNRKIRLKKIEKRILEQARCRGVHVNYLASNPHHNDCSYFVDMQQQFLQRTNTYINSHSKHSGMRGEGATVSLPRLPHHQLPRNEVEKPKQSANNNQGPPGGRKMPRTGTPSFKNHPGAVTSFEPDFPDKTNMAQWNTKFVPMQFRTQPSNLAPTSLQRVNTTLLGEPKGVQFKRVEALTRSHTLLEMKQGLSQSSTTGITLGEQADLFQPLSPHKNKDRYSSGGSKNQKSLLTTAAARHKEPDSMFLQHSWSNSANHKPPMTSARS